MARHLSLLVCTLFAGLLLHGCGKSNEAPPTTGRADAIDSLTMTDLRKQRWARTCALCHVGGQGGAPVVGDQAAWSARLAQGEDVVLEHTIQGFENMPPLGYCMDCERDDLRAYIRFMAGGAGA
jgi:cytochrome c5